MRERSGTARDPASVCGQKTRTINHAVLFKPDDGAVAVERFSSTFYCGMTSETHARAQTRTYLDKKKINSRSARPSGQDKLSIAIPY